jgi:hypothetical protein
LYRSFDQLIEMLDGWVQHGVPVSVAQIQERAEVFGWKQWRDQYDHLFEKVVRNRD